jgi:hypothetical protein
MSNRDPEISGLVTILHPWESGLDDLPKFKRLDIIAVGGASETIPSDWEYNRFIYLIELMKKYHYDQKRCIRVFLLR